MRLFNKAPWVGCAIAMSTFAFGQTITHETNGTGLELRVASAEAQSKPAKKKNKKKKKAKKNKKAKSVTACVDYSQSEEELGMSFQLDSACDMDLECNVSWQLSCEGDSKKTKRKAGKVFYLSAGTSGGVSASAAVCGDAGWQIANVRWSCKGA